MELYTDAAFSDVHTVAKAAGGLRTFVKTSQKNIEKRLAKVEELPFKTIKITKTRVANASITPILSNAQLLSYIKSMSNKPTTPGLYQVTVTETIEPQLSGGSNFVVTIQPDIFNINDERNSPMTQIDTSATVILIPSGGTETTTNIIGRAVVTSTVHCFIGFHDKLTQMTRVVSTAVTNEIENEDITVFGRIITNRNINIIDLPA